LRTDVNVPSESNKQNKLEKDEFFVGILKVPDEKTREKILNGNNPTINNNGVRYIIKNQVTNLVKLSFKRRRAGPLRM
jgi:hypothetical protein